MGIEVGEHGELHTLPAIAWAASFVVCGIGDALLGDGYCYRSSSPRSTGA
jgi:hypothetical protein